MKRKRGCRYQPVPFVLVHVPIFAPVDNLPDLKTSPFRKISTIILSLSAKLFCHSRARNFFCSALHRACACMPAFTVRPFLIEHTQPFPRLKLQGEAGLPGLLAFPPDCRSRHSRALSLFRGCRGVGEKQKLFFVFHTPRTFPERTTIGTGVPPGASEIFLRALLAPGVFCPNDPIGELNIFR